MKNSSSEHVINGNNGQESIIKDTVNQVFHVVTKSIRKGNHVMRIMKNLVHKNWWDGQEPLWYSASPTLNLQVRVLLSRLDI